MSAAVFLDRDGTIIEDTGYVADPDQVRLVDGAAEAIRRFSAIGYRVVVVSNQSGVARGLLDEAGLARVHARMEELLAERGAKLDETYYCPYLDGPEATAEEYRRNSELRKPRPGMLLEAAKDLDIDLTRSWMIGDSARDVEAGRGAGCRTILLERDGVAEASPVGTLRAKTIVEAAEIVERSQRSEGLAPDERSKFSVPAPGGCEAAETNRLLGQLRDRLDQLNRTGQQQDFSILRLGGALLQMLAIVSGLWGVLALFDDAPANATARLALAGFLQIASLSAYLVDRFR